MHKSLWLFGLASVSCLVFFAFSLQSPAYGQRNGLVDASPTERRWISQIAASVDSAPHVLTVVDPDLGSIAVYHVDKISGDIELRSVRKIEWDLVLEEYNGCKSSPHPAEIRSMLKRPVR
jgi:hypothetical protein